MTKKGETMRSIKFPFKLLHQVIALSKNSKILKSISIRRVSLSWPEGNALGLTSEVQFRGLVIAKVWVPPERILVTNDILPDLTNLSLADKNIPIKESKRLAVSEIRSREIKEGNMFDEETRDYIKRFDASFAKLDYLTQNAQGQMPGTFSCHVVVKLSGDVVIIDGIHRAIASYLVNGNFDSLEMLVTL